MPPALVVSLDFELFWGLRDHVPLSAYRDNLLGVRQAVPELLRLFSSRSIHATWATVGFLFCRTKEELLATLPDPLPHYADPALSPYAPAALDAVGPDEVSDPFHFAPSLIEAIAATPGQEVATHTFSHYYCLADGQSEATFDADLTSADVAAARLGIQLRSLVFPRNQENPAYRSIMANHGLEAIRGTVGGWPHSGSSGPESRVKRAVRLADSFLPLAGARSFPLPRPDRFGLVDVPGSAFLRPYAAFTTPLGPLGPLKLQRLTRAMTTAASRGELFHLWWHPHNFGVHLRENLAMLTVLLDHFGTLRRRYGMQSLSMHGVATLAKSSSATRNLNRSA